MQQLTSSETPLVLDKLVQERQATDLVAHYFEDRITAFIKEPPCFLPSMGVLGWKSGVNTKIAPNLRFNTLFLNNHAPGDPFSQPKSILCE